jgi:hypothetical protein
MDDIKETLKRYVENKIPTGGFLQSVLENDLFEAVARADRYNIHRIYEICDYIYNNLPYQCWGDKEKVEKWLKK